MKWMVFALLILISCAPATQEVTTKPVMDKVPMQAKPIAQPATLEPQVKAPQEQQKIEATELPQATTAPKSDLSSGESCVDLCKQNCEASAQNACTQEGRPQCKAGCGDIIEPSACVQACTYVPRQPQDCKRMFSDFCSAQCIGYCH